MQRILLTIIILLHAEMMKLFNNEKSKNIKQNKLCFYKKHINWSGYPTA